MRDHKELVYQAYEQALASLHTEADRPEDSVLSETELKEDAKVSKAGSGGGGGRREKRNKNQKAGDNPMQAAMLQEMKQTNTLLAQLVLMQQQPRA
jgi:hypothetical protein